MATPKIFVFCNDTSCPGTIEGSHRSGWHHFIAIAEDGHTLAGHICSAHGYAAHDMGVSPDGWKRDLYAKHYPDGFEVELVDRKDPRLDAVFELNAKLAPATEAV